MSSAVLVDTSAWIRAYAGVQPYRDVVDRLLQDDRVIGHDFVYGELLIGDKGARAERLALYDAAFQRAPVVAHDEVVSLIRERKLFGAGIGWIDAHLLAATLVSRAQLYSADKALMACARRLGVAYS
ncbi:MAG TPA: PIN domain-containing protein [Polyangiales bacterium]